MQERCKFWIMAVDENRVVRDALKRFLEEEPDWRVHLENGPRPDIMETIARIQPALLIMDLVFENVDGQALLESIRARFPDLPIIVCSMQSEFIYAEPVLASGANGYVMKMDAAEFIIPAIRQVLKGETYLSQLCQQKRLKKAAHS